MLAGIRATQASAARPQGGDGRLCQAFLTGEILTGIRLIRF